MPEDATDDAADDKRDNVTSLEARIARQQRADRHRLIVVDDLEAACEAETCLGPTGRIERRPVVVQRQPDRWFSRAISEPEPEPTGA
jgi:hypothetical protein